MNWPDLQKAQEPRCQGPERRGVPFEGAREEALQETELVMVRQGRHRVSGIGKEVKVPGSLSGGEDACFYREAGLSSYYLLQFPGK